MANRLAAALVAALVTGCFSTDEGIEPPLDRLYFPVGLALDREQNHLFVANSNFDLQFNGGSLQTLDLVRIRSLVPRACKADGTCDGGLVCDNQPNDANQQMPSGWCVAPGAPPCGSLGDKSEADRLLYPGRCRPVSLTSPPDGQGSLIVDAVGIGAFATDVIYRTRPEKVNGRLFVPVRGDATMHWIDVEDGGKLDCGQSANGGNCDDPHRVGDDPDVENTRRLRMPPEPFGIDATEDGRAIVISHQTEGQASLVVNDWASRSPVLEFVVPNLPKRPMGVAAIPEPELVTVQGLDYQPGFLLTFRDAAEIHLLRFFDDRISDPERPFISDSFLVPIRAASVGFDSRGIALDKSARQSCEKGCSGDIDCLTRCAAIPLGVYVANRAPSSLLVGRTRITNTPTSSDDLPNIFDTAGLPFGPSRVVVGQIIDLDGQLATRVFVVCFDTRFILIYDPERGRIEDKIETGRGPHAFAVDTPTLTDPPHALGYIGHFTDSYIGVVELDRRSPNYAQIVVTLARPFPPRASK